VTTMPKQEPVPFNESAVVAEALNRASAGKPDDDLSILLKVVGGAPGQRYRFEFDALGAKLRACTLDCDLTDRHYVAEERERSGMDIQSLAHDLLRSKVLESVPEPAKFLPDTIVGILKISSGRRVYRTYFAADPDQASVQGRTPQPEVTAAVEAIYSAAAKVLGTDAVRP
jgi:hypothetical protein